MATIISSNFYLTNTQMEDNAGLIGYQNLVTPSTISATSQISTNPITNAANPATAWGWIAGDQPASADSIAYTGTNLMPSPFDPEGWLKNANGTITNTTSLNPSGSPFVGLAEANASANFILNQADEVSVDAGDSVYFSIIIKEITPLSEIEIQIKDNNSINADEFIRFSSDGSVSFANPDLSYMVTNLSDGYILIQVEYANLAASTGMDSLVFLRAPTTGDQLYVQAAYFGKADDYPAVIATQGVIKDQTITINTARQEVDYIGIAKHNLNQIGLTVTIKYNGITVVPAQSVSDKQALLFLNNIASPDTVEIIISGATSPPRIAVLYVGKALRLQRNIYVGHTPISYGRKRTAINGVSENGQYLGEIVVREMNMTSVNLQNLTPDWYRQNLDPFFALSPRVPCFWAWRPSKYEDEVGYCWVEGDPQMSNQRSNGMVECSWNFKGIV